MEENKDQKKELSMDDLKGIIQEVVKTSTKAEVDALRKEMAEKDRQSIFAGDDGRHLETVGKSLIDTSYFAKAYRDKEGREFNGKELAEHFRHGSGPWVKLSPAMEKFAMVLMCGGDPMKMIARGLDLKAYNDMVLAEQKDTAVGLTTTDVGALVPMEFLATVVEFATAQSAIIPKVWRIPMGSLTMRIPRLSQAAGSYFGGVTLYHPEEAELKQESKPTFDYLSFTAKKMIGIIPLSDEVVMDSAVAIINYVTGLFTRAFQYKIEGEIISGTGLLGQMTGILTDTGINLVPRQTVGTVKYDDLINLESSIDENFTNMTFLSRRATVNVFRKQKDSVGQPVYHDGFSTMFGGAIGPQLLGYPVIKTRNIPALGVQGDLILGDLGFYIWALRQDMTIDTSKDARFFYDQTVVRFVMRMDGQPGVSIAFAVLDNVPES
jgi:HK97 family phage major capsid protein